MFMTRELSDKTIPELRRSERDLAALARDASSLLPFTADMIDVNELDTLLTGSPVPEDKSLSWLSAPSVAASMEGEEAKSA